MNGGVGDLSARDNHRSQIASITAQGWLNGE